MNRSTGQKLWEAVLRTGAYRLWMRPWLDRHPQFKARWRARILRRLDSESPSSVAPLTDASGGPSTSTGPTTGVPEVQHAAPSTQWSEWDEALHRARQRLQESCKRP